MKFLLAAINAKYIHSNPAIYSLRAYAGEKLQEHVELAEYTINQYVPEILPDIYRRKPDVIGFSCYIWNWRMVQDLLAEVPKILPGVPIWLGGPEVSFDCEEILQKYPQLAGIMVGEGEATFQELLEYYVGRKAFRGEDTPCAEVIELHGTVEVSETGKLQEAMQVTEGCEDGQGLPESEDLSLRDIPGLCLPGGYTSMRALTDMSSIPFLYHDLKPFENKIIYYESSRGCPFRCSYCLSSIDKAVRLRDMSVVKKELQFFLDNRVKQVKFVDRTFNCNHDHAMAIWQYIYEHDNGVTNFHFEISADILREDEIELLNRLRPGLAQLEIGVQSTNPQTLQAIKRVMNVEKLEKIVASIHRGKNVHQHLDLIAGLPFEDYASFGESFDRVYRMRPEQLQLGFLKVLKGSEMWERAEEYGICYQEQPPYEVLYTKWLSYEDVLRLKQVEEMVELYYNSGQFTHTLAFLERAFASPFAMFEALADFYEREGYFVNSPARAYRYQVLLSFARECDGANEEIYRELLTYDMYLRENLKSRPDFAADLQPHKDTVRDFYRKEEQERRYLPHYEGYDWKQLSKMTHLEPFHYPVWDVERLAEAVKTGEAVRLGAVGKHKIVANAENVPSPAGVAIEECTVRAESVMESDCIFVLFDYQKRNPLNYEARTYCVESGANLIKMQLFGNSEPLPLMKKVIVIGCPGSGKSTFSRTLHNITKLPIYHLDMMYWNADRTTVPKEIFRERLQQAMAQEAWIIDGNYGSTMELRMQACDTVIFLDFSPEVCLEGIQTRRGKARPDMPWMEAADEVDEEFIGFIKNYNTESRPVVMELLEKYADRKIYIFRSRGEADDFLAQMKI